MTVAAQRISQIDTRRAEGIRGWMSRGELRWLAEQASSAETVIEVGCFAGRSAVAMAEHLPAGGVLWCVEPMVLALPGLSRKPGGVIADQDECNGIYQELQRNLRGLPARLVRATSREAFDILVAEGVRADFIFLDGDHSYGGVSEDIFCYGTLLRPGGTIAGHDFYDSERLHPGVRRAVLEVFPADAVAHPVGSIWAVTP